MVFHIQFQTCGLIMVIMVMYFFYRKATLQLIRERVYSALLISVFVCIILDISSIIVMNVLKDVSLILVNIVCKTYLFSITVVTMLILYYTLIDIYHNYNEVKKFIRIYLIPILLYAVITPFLPIHYVLEKERIYSYGGDVIVTYIISAFYLFISLFYIIKYREKMNKERRASVIFLLSAFSVTAFIQFTHNEWLLVGFAMSAAMVFMYLSLENPDDNMDKTTNIFNKYAYHTYLNDLIYKKKDFCILTITLGDIRFMNETFGLKNVNQLLYDMANYLNTFSESKVFRSGGDDFSILFTERGSKTEHSIAVIRERFMKPWHIGEVKTEIKTYIVKLDQSLWISSIDELLDTIRYFLLQLKKEGKNQYVCIDEKRLERRDNLDLVERALHKAIQKEELQVYFQPIYSNEKKKYLSAEALARIFDEEGHPISPDIFIPMAEQNGMILELGMLVFKKVCKFVEENHLMELGIEYLEINLSVVQCMQEDLANQLICVMEEYHIPPTFINLEITETVAINSPNILEQNMDKLLRRGTTFSLDDYGTGYSNLNYIVGLPFYLVKLDKSLVWSYFELDKAKIAMEFAISMIKHLGMKIVAEGIETLEQFEKMEELGVDYLQGFYFSKPLQEKEFLDLILRQKVT